MKLLTVLVTSFLVIILLCENCIAALNDDHPLKMCAKAVLNGKEKQCFNIFLQSLMANEEWSDEEPRKLCSRECTVKRRGYFKNFQWVWEAHYRCESTVPGIVGIAMKKSQNGATLWAIDDFIKKAVATGRYEEKDFQCRSNSS